MIIIPIGIPPWVVLGEAASNVGITIGGGGVKVGMRVGGISKINCAASVGSIVGVTRGVGVGGGATMGSSPVGTLTRNE